MGVVDHLDIHGSKGGESKPKSPIEAADSLRSTNLAKILIAVGEGEFDGVPTAADIYLDNTPLNDASGNVNFPNVKWEWRSGSVEQDYIPGIPSVENETTVNVELRSDSPWVRSVTNTQLSAVRVRLAWPVLQQQDDNGNVGGYRIEYAIDVATDGGAYQQVLNEAVDGKTTTRYERSRRIDLPAATSGWQIRVRRLTPNQNTNKIADTMIIAGLTEVIDEKLRYPNTALLFVEFDAEQFSNIPAVTVKCNARKWQVPSNYDPVARTYSGVWDGTFKQAWTNNPAWITFGICTVDRFGLGKRIKSFMVDKWELYRIAQYCDQLVPNGIGGQEPRFLCDMNLQGKAEAWTLLRDISAIYRGMTYWAQGQLIMQADMPRAQDFDYVFTRSNVIDGTFDYGSASAKTRYTRAIVSYDNPANNYDTDVTAFSDLALQRRFGDTPVEISAIGCTRASEAQRRGKWAVMSNNQDRTVSFKTGMEGAIPLPGYIIPIADSLLAGREIGGRISAAAGRVVTLDRDTMAKAGDRLIINLPSGKAEGRTVQAAAGRAVTVTTAYSETPTPQLQWALDADDLAIPLYRVLSTKRTAEGDYEISALQYEPSKFAYIDTGARLEERPISVIPITVVPAPASVTITATSAVDQGISVSTMTIAWPPVNGAVGYDVEWRKDNGNWIRVQRTGSTSVDITGIYSGAYLARVRAVSAYDISSVWRSSQLTQLNGKVGLPPAVTSLTTESLIFGIGLKWTFPPGAEDTQRTELWYSEAPDLATATKLADLAYPQSDYSMQGLRAGQSFFFWARLVDRTGNIGPWYPVAPTVVNGQASADADDILDYLTGQITESQLGQELLGEIGKIGGDGEGSVNERLDQVRTDLGDQITDVSNTVAEVQSELQAQIDQIADLADSMPYKADQTYTTGQGVLGADGIIYQAIQNVPVSTPPPNTTYWLNVGQAVQTANGLAARVTTAETKITSIEGVNTAQANQITGLQTSLDGKADSSVVSSLSSRVTTAENTISSQGTAITGLNNSLTTTNQNVTAAQNAANAANTLAGGKGKVIVQSAAPAAADQLAQNLWIDTTGNANTPKRWTGSAWAAVTDKAATDAAAAAASALAQVATKAEASTVQALSNTVTQQGSDLAAAGSAITNITANLSSVGGQNLVYNPSFERSGTTAGLADGWYVAGSNAAATGAPALVDSSLVPGEKAQRLSLSGLSASIYYLLGLDAAHRPAVQSSSNYTVSFSVKAPAGMPFRPEWRAFRADGSESARGVGTNTLGNGGWQRVTLTYATPADAVACVPFIVIYGTSAISSGVVDVDRAQLELGSVASGWRDNGQVSATDIATQAAATTALTGRVSQTETGLTSVSGQLTTLNNSIGNLGGQNLVYNSSFEKAGPVSGVADGWFYDFAGGTRAYSLPKSGLDPAGVAQRVDSTGLSTTVWQRLTQEFVKRTLVAAGTVLTGSVYVRATAGLQIKIQVNGTTDSGSITEQLQTALVPATGGWQRLVVSFTTGSSTTGLQAAVVFYGSASVTAGFVEVDNYQLEAGSVATGWRDNGQVAASDQSATSAAVSGLQSTVTQQGATLTSVANRTTTLENAVNSTTNGLATKASASSVDSLTNRVTAAEGALTSTATSVTSLTASVRAANAAGDNIVSNPTFDPAYNQMSFTVVASTASGVPASCPFKYVARLGSRDHVPALATVPFVATKPGEVWRLSALVACASGSAVFNHYIQVGSDVSTVQGTGSGGGGQAATTSWTRVTWDYVVPANTYFVRPFLQVEQASANPTTVWYATDWHMENITVAKAAQSTADATATALTSTNATVTQQGNTITSQGQSISGLQSTVGNHTAQLQQQATTIADSAGKISAAYTVRLQVAQNGVNYVAGFGIGLDNSSGIAQSQFVVAADRFAVIRDVAGNVTSPFIIENGQVFMSDAVIKKATIANAVVGQYLRSAAKSTNGQDIMTLDMVAGQVLTRNNSGTNYCQMNNEGIFGVSNGVVLFELRM